ncbi:hypothetical protein [Altererythrobacter sp. Z27]|uniref:hypothetical protein n=1 Tax=Altererythrobacter sp. Z27 TaxID=3461147 RepID=UPI004044A7B8
MTKERARKRKRERLLSDHKGARTPSWGPAVLTFGFMIVFMGIWRLIQKGEDFAWTDALFVASFAIVMALLVYFRPRLFQ